ncbi:MAG: hypothetical protein V4736_06865, partial [Bdellovibrionota bacterium]
DSCLPRGYQRRVNGSNDNSKGEALVENLNLYTLLFFVAFGAQGLLLVADEIFFHYRRGLPAWERWGHPLDTLTVLLPFISLFLFPENLFLFAGLALISTLFVTKDEWVHNEECGPGEQWLHSLLFILHPVVFYLGYLAARDSGVEFLPLVMTALVLFMIYQIFYWNVYENRKSRARL